MWNNLEIGFQKAFEIGWEAYCKKNDKGRRGHPIGAAITNKDGAVVAAAHNQIIATGNGLISHHCLAHAEINSMLMLKEGEHSDVKTYTLYTTLESCTLCFGAIAMGNIKKTLFAARDPFGGMRTRYDSAETICDYKAMTFEGPFAEPERVQMTMLAAIEYTYGGAYPDRYINMMKPFFERELEMGEKISRDKTLEDFADSGVGIDTVYDSIISLLC